MRDSDDRMTAETERQPVSVDFNEAPITISDVLTKLNSTIRAHSDITSKAINPINQKTKGFELNTRLPDGSARPATVAEIAMADFQSKLQHSITILQSLPDDSAKFKWAEYQRKNVGNAYYENQEYERAIDVYLTCLTVAAPPSTPDPDTKYTMDYLILYMKVMNNLALCTMQLQWYRKTVIFCTMAIDQISTTLPTFEMNQSKTTSITDEDDDDIVTLEQRMKLHYKRAKAYRLKGEYEMARLDINYIKTELSDHVVNTLSTKCLNNSGSDRVELLRDTTSKEEKLLQRAIIQGHKNLKQHQMAMKQLLNPSNDFSSTSTKEGDSLFSHDINRTKTIQPLYHDQHTANPQLQRRNFSSLRAGKDYSDDTHNCTPLSKRTIKMTNDRTVNPKNGFGFVETYDAMARFVEWLCHWIDCFLSFCFRSRSENKRN